MGKRQWHECDAEATKVVAEGLEAYEARLRRVAAFAADEQVLEIATTARNQADAVAALRTVISVQLEPLRAALRGDW
jgi:hypothetical protein